VIDLYIKLVQAAILTTVLIILWVGLYVFVRGVEIVLD
jgi:hypothetical protein